MKRCLPAAALFLFAFQPGSLGKELEGVYKPAQNACPAPEEAIKKMTVPPGYEVRCFASEPMVVNPVAMTWDHRGRLWVVELYEYPRGAKNPNEYSKIATDEKFRPVVKADANSPRDRVVILEDTDNDGKADKRTVFVEGLSLATAVLCGYDGVFVGQAPNLFFFRDTNGDDKADEYKTVLTGFGMEDRHELLNSFCWGPDGWMYMTHGVFTHSKVRRPEQKPEEGFTLNAGVFRVKLGTQESGADGSAAPGAVQRPAPHASSYEVFADGTSNPWGVDFDARGNAFVSACVIDHLFHMAPGGIYQRQGGAPENPYAYEMLPSIVDFKHFRAAYAGIQIYQGGIYPADTHGHLFIGNIHDNAIHEESLTPVGATFKAAPVRDFLRANDGWFRPVSTQTGPDGFLWIMDWCDKYPCYQNAQANPEGVDREHGRIWRVCYTGSDAGKKMAGMSRGENEMDFAKLSFLERAKLVGYSNNWISRQASLAHSRFDGDDDGLRSPAVLFSKAADSKILSERLAAIDAIAIISPNFGNLTPKEASPLLSRLATDPDASIRRRALVILAELPVRCLKEGGWMKKEGLELKAATCLAIAKAASDSDAPVRLQVASLMRREHAGYLTVNKRPAEGESPQGWQDAERAVFADLITASKEPADKTLALTIWMAMEPAISSLPASWLPWLADLAPKTKPLSHVLTYKTARRITDTRSGEYMDLLLAFLDKIKDDDVLTANALDGMMKAQEAGAVKPAKSDPAPFFARWASSKSADVRNHAGRLATLWGDKAAVTALIKVAEDPNTDAARRAEAIRTLRKLNSDEARAALLRILEQAVPR